ncbi:hypothetical protein [Phormidium sp. CCY1219]|uniref:hypothetical protein n=1 Tax=Phormidium sp. CCY1219 TaxID=2886104 RepID=UPI002D1EB2EC|nr:hypothetical protein [Phormidium sp. CCY1219]MEB3831055.1 hypothetical protein [Phormidium sp. CCY1219]
MLKINTLSLYGFTYTLKQGLGVKAETTTPHYESFLHNLVQLIGDEFKTSFSQETERKFCQVDEVKVAQLPFTGRREQHTLEGEYRRWSEEDSWVLVFNAYTIASYDKGEAIAFLKCMQEFLQPPEKLQTIGHSLVLSAVLESGTEGEIKEFAKLAYQHLIDNRGWKQEKEGVLWDGKIWQFWRSQPQQWQKIEPNSHLTLVFYRDRAQLDAGAKLLVNYWRPLWLSRDKILWAYRNSRQLKSTLVGDYNTLNFAHPLSELNLTELTEAIETQFRFKQGLNSVEINQTTIEIHLNNYDNYRETLIQNAQVNGPVKLDYLAEFSQQVQQTYLPQLQKDANSLRRCWDDIARLADTINSLLEIRQAHRDRTFQAVVGIFGIGLGTGGMVASASSNYVEDIKGISIGDTALDEMPFTRGWSDLHFVLGLSVFSGTLAGVVTLFIILAWRFFRR